jgi:hypothetical protein
MQIIIKLYLNISGVGQPQSLFGQPMSTSGSSIFGGSMTTSQAGQMGATTSSLFGQAQPSASIFGGPPTAQPTSIFGQPAQMGTSPAFGGAPAQSSPFQNQSIFGATPTQQPSSGIFGGHPPQQQQQQQQQSSSIFGQPPTTMAAPSPFATQTPFGNVVPAFGAPDSAKPGGNLFGNRNEAEMGSAFGARPTVGGGGLFGEVIEPQHDSSTYTPMEKLGKELFDIYQSGKFELGKIPELPPPQELCG